MLLGLFLIDYPGNLTAIDAGVCLLLPLLLLSNCVSRDAALFYMHRGFFARAIEDNPDDPMGSKYAQSVLAAYNSACSFVGLIKSLYSLQPGLTERMWFLFTHVFSCAVSPAPPTSQLV